MDDLDARVSALEAERADYKAVLSAVNALGANQRERSQTLREHGETLRDHGERLVRLESKLDDTNTRVRSLEDGQSEIKDLLVRALEK
ncbi:hypothetical protein BI330_16390 [Mycobacterium sp. CBMA 623]|nr:hypothetical protein [Mycobacteroides sp. CBMA 326]